MADSTLTLKLDKDSIFNLLEGLRGPKGDVGDRGPEGPQGKEGEQGPKGEPASAERAAELLKQKNVYLPDASVETVLAKLVELFGDSINVTFKQLGYSQPVEGQTFLDLKGEPHFKVSVNGGEKRVFESDNMRVPIAPFGQNDIRVEYFDLVDRAVGSISIKGLEPTDVEDTYEDATGAKFAKIGRKLVLRLNDYRGGSFNLLGKWNKQDIETIEFIADTKKTVVDNSYTNNKYQGLTFIIKQPQNISFDMSSANLGTVTINTLERSVQVKLQYSLEWNGATYEEGL